MRLRSAYPRDINGSETSFPKDTRHFPIREWLCFGQSFKTRRILSCVLQEQKARILRGNLGVVLYKLQI